MKKRILSFVLTICMIIGLTTAIPAKAATAASGRCGDNLTWSLDDDGTLTISGKGRMYNYSNWYYIPWKNSYIKKIIIESQVTSIGDYAFSNCYDLEKIEISTSVSNIGRGAFYNCINLESITIPEGVLYIESGTFSGCKNLVSVSLPKTVTDVSNGAFWGASSLENIIVDLDSLYLYSDDGVLFNKRDKRIITYPAGKKDTTYSIPEGVLEIGKYTFYECNYLKNILISESVTSIEDNVFYGCINVEKIEVEPGNKNYISINDILYSKDKSKLIYFPANKNVKTLVIDENVKNIAFNAFEKCNYIEDVTVPEGVIYAGFQNFRYCINLKKVSVPKSLKSSICEWFWGSDNLEVINYNGTLSEWYEIDGSYGYNDHVKIKCTDTELNPFIPSSYTQEKGSTDFDPSSDKSKPYYNNTVKINSTINGDYTIKDSNVTVNSGKNLNITGKLTIENGTLSIEKGGVVTAQNIEIKTKGNVYANGTLTVNGEIIAKGGSDLNSGSCLSVGSKGTISTENISLYDFAKLELSGKLYANNFLIQTKINSGYFAPSG